MNERLTFTAARGHGDAPSWRAPQTDAANVQHADAIAPRPEPAERRDWAFIFLLVFTGLVFLRPQDTFHVLEPLHLAELSALGGLLALVGGRLARGQSISRVTPELAGVVTLGMLILALAPFSIWLGGAVGVFKEMYSKIILIYLLMVNVLSSPRRIERLTWLMILTGAYLGFRAVLDGLRGAHMVEHGRVEGAVGGMFKNPNDLALNMVALLPLAGFLMLKRGPALKRLTAAGCVVLMLGAVVMSRSRSGTLGLVAMLAVFGWFALRQKPGLVLAGLLACAVAAPLLPSGYWERIASIAGDAPDDTGSKEARRVLFHESLQAFLENPLTGVGAGQFKNWNPDGREQPWRESHDVILQVGSELGVVGLAVFLFLVVRAGLAALATRRLLHVARVAARRRAAPGRGQPPANAPVLTPEETTFFDGFSAAILAAVVGWFVCALFASVAYNWTFYYLLALAAAPRDALRARIPARASARTVGAGRLEAAHA